MSTIVDLNGEWDFLWDSDNTGMDSRWYATYPEAVQKVQVPHVWEKAFAKPGSTIAYYFKRFSVDSAENAKRIFLRFERVATHATVWLNGKLIGEHFGSWSPFVLDTSKAIKLGEENVLCLRVASVETGGKIDFGRESPENGGERYAHNSEMPVGLPWQQYPFAGIYGDVKLILGNRAFITDVYVVTDPDQERIHVDVSFNNPRNFQAKLRILVRNPDGEISEMLKEVKLEKENTSTKLQLGFKEFQWWSPEKPRLYTIEVKLEKSFSVLTGFGFRKFDCVKGDFYLNDRILKLQGIRYSQHWSEGGIWHPDTNVLRKDLEHVKRLGFNVIRSGGAPLDKRALDICDEIGLLVFQEFPVHTMRSSPRGLEKVRELTEEFINDARNHPSVVVWVLGAENGTLMLENGTKLLKNIDAFDRTRPVISNLNCVWIDNEQGFKKDTGKVMGVTNDRILLYPSHRMNLRMNPSANLSYFLAHYCDKDNAELSVPDPFLGDSQFQDDYQTFVQETNGKILVTLKNHTLINGLSQGHTKITGPRSLRNAKAILAMAKQLNAFVDSEGKGIWKNTDEFLASARAIALKSKLDHINALQSNHQVSGFFLDQWADIGTDLSGLVDENRHSKHCDAFVKEITTGTRLLVCGLERTAVPKEEVVFQISLLNEARLDDVEVQIRVLDLDGKQISVQKKAAKGQTSLTPLGDFSFLAPKQPGLYRVCADLIVDGKERYTSTDSLAVLDESDIKAAMKQVCFLDNAESSSGALASLSGKERIIFTSSISSWNAGILTKMAEEAKAGKTLFISDMNNEDIEAFNACKQFDYTLEAHYTTGSDELSVHYIPPKSPLVDVFGGRPVLDSICSAVMPSMSLSPLPGAEVYAKSISVVDGEVKTGVDLQVLPFGKGKLVFNQFSLIEGLESNAMANHVFTRLVKLLA